MHCTEHYLTEPNQTKSLRNLGSYGLYKMIFISISCDFMHSNICHESLSKIGNGRTKPSLIHVLVPVPVLQMKIFISNNNLN